MLKNTTLSFKDLKKYHLILRKCTIISIFLIVVLKTIRRIVSGMMEQIEDFLTEYEGSLSKARLRDQIEVEIMLLEHEFLKVEKQAQLKFWRTLRVIWTAGAVVSFCTLLIGIVVHLDKIIEVLK